MIGSRAPRNAKRAETFAAHLTVTEASRGERDDALTLTDRIGRVGDPPAIAPAALEMAGANMGGSCGRALEDEQTRSGAAGEWMDRQSVFAFGNTLRAKNCPRGVGEGTAPTRFAKEASRKDAGRFNGSQRCHKAFDVGPTKNWASHKYFLFPSVVLFLSLVFRVPLLLHTQFRRRHDSRRAPPP